MTHSHPKKPFLRPLRSGRLGWLGSLLALCVSWQTPSCNAELTSVVIAQDADLASLQKAIASVPMLANELNQANPSTVFAPTNEALSAQATLMTRLSQPEWIAHLAAFIKFHVVTGDSTLPAASLTNGLELEETLYEYNTDKFTVTVSGGEISISGEAFQGSKVVQWDLAADNGVVHKVDQVFMPSFLTLNLFETSEQIKGFSIALPFIVKAGLENTLRNDLVTLFGPNIAALTQLEASFVSQVANDDEAIRLLFNNHIATGIWPTERLTNGAQITMLSGQTYTISVEGDVIKVGDAPIVRHDGLASNGVAHELMRVLLPPTLEGDLDSKTPSTAETQPAAGVAAWMAQQTDLSSFSTAIQTAGLTSFLSSTTSTFTVFAPNDAAVAASPLTTGGALAPLLLDSEWKAHLVALVKFHVHAGRLAAAGITNGLAISNMAPLHPPESYVATVDASTSSISLTSDANPSSPSKVVAADLSAAENGLVHKVDQVLIPAALTHSLVDELAVTADFYAGFGEVLPLLVQAGLDDMLRTQKVTLFAPGNQAIANLKATGVLDRLLSDPVNQLGKVLKNHIVPGIHYKEKLVDGMTLTSLIGQMLKVKVTGAGRFKLHTIQGAYLDASDIVAQNGLAHVIDTVWLPDPADFVCSVCERGMNLSLPDTEINIPPGVVDGIDKASCALVDVVVNNSPGQFDEGLCEFLRGLYTKDCGCVLATKSHDNNDRALLRRG